MPWDKLSTVLRILDTENRLLERADQKAISLLSILGVFMVFFIVYYRVIPVNPLTVTLIIIYFVFALLAILNLIMTVRPRIRAVQEESTTDAEETPPPCEPAFFAGICQFPKLSAYRNALENMIRDETDAINIYTRQIYSLAKINAAKYKYIQRAIFLVITAITTELAIIIYLFIVYLGEGIMPPIR
jgi:hypothetical protein